MFNLVKTARKYERWHAVGKSYSDILMARKLNKVMDMIEDLPEDLHREMMQVIIHHLESEVKLLDAKLSTDELNNPDL